MRVNMRVNIVYGALCDGRRGMTDRRACRVRERETKKTIHLYLVMQPFTVGYCNEVDSFLYPSTILHCKLHTNLRWISPKQDCLLRSYI